MNYDAFISYRRNHGSQLAQLIHDRLQQQGLSVFMDREVLRSGKFNEEIYDAIRNCRNFILVLPENALDRCVNEGDWLRKEIMEALRLEYVNIIPIFCDGFHWPEPWPQGIPAEIRQLQHRNAVPYSHDYFDAFIEKTVSFMKDVSLRQAGAGETPVSVTPVEYFTGYLDEPEEVASVDMAFHAGAKWHGNPELTKIRKTMVDTGIPLRILINTPAAANIVAPHMRQEDNLYFSFQDCLTYWARMQQKAPKTVQVRVCDIPLLRIYHSFHMRNPERDTVNVKHYTYANPQVDKNYQGIFHRSSPYFELFRSEFEYLWQRSTDVGAVIAE